MNKRFFATVLGTLFIGTAFAASPNVETKELDNNIFAPLKEGKDYYKVKINTETNKNIVAQDYSKPVIVDFFWYGCGHCNNQRPLFNSMTSTLKNIEVVKFPAAFRGWEAGTKLYFVYKSMGILDKMHNPTFEAVHKERKDIFRNQQVLEEFLKKNNVDVQEFNKTSQSFAINKDMSFAKDVTANYNLQSTPTTGVYYKGFAYLTNPSMTGSYAKTVEVTKVLAEKTLEASQKNK